MKNWIEIYFESFPTHEDKTVVGTLKNKSGGRVNCYYEFLDGKNVITIRQSLDNGFSYPHICTDRPYTPEFENREKEFKQNIYPLMIKEYNEYIN